ncbi:MAG: type II toxin-antitoxin system RelE/ParE family toxin [Sneathiellaceae bacterium]
MAEVRLSKAAAADLEEIALYGLRTFGQVQARRYQQGIVARIARIAETPLLYPSVEHIRPGYRRSVYESHVIYYRIDEARVLVVRILGRQDLDPGLN